MDIEDSVWIFSGAGGRFASAVFADENSAREWIVKSRVSGILTEYPIGISAYDWALKNNHFVIKKDFEREAKFVQNFSSGAQKHFHFELGLED